MYLKAEYCFEIVVLKTSKKEVVLSWFDGTKTETFTVPEGGTFLVLLGTARSDDARHKGPVR